jgi:hypothetical protein
MERNFRENRSPEVIKETIPEYFQGLRMMYVFKYSCQVERVNASQLNFRVQREEWDAGIYKMPGNFKKKKNYSNSLGRNFKYISSNWNKKPLGFKNYNED